MPKSIIKDPAATQDEAVNTEENVTLEESTEDVSLWESMAPEVDDDDSEVVLEGDQEVVEEPPVVVEKEKTSEEEETPTEEETPKAEEPPVEPFKAPEEEAQKPPLEEAPKEDANAVYTQQLEALAKTYEFSEEDALALQTEPEIVLPKLAANLHANILRSVMLGVQATIPQMIERANTQQASEQSAWDKFFEVNQDLRGQATKEQILKVGQIYRTIHPTASEQEALTGIGNVLRQTLGIAQASVQNTQEQQSASTDPQVTQQRVKPFTPALGSSPSQPAKPTNIWDELAGDDF